MKINNNEIYFRENFLSPEECAVFRSVIDGIAVPSTVSSDYSSGGEVLNSARTSSTGHLDVGIHPIIALVNARMSELIGVSDSSGETLQGQMYREGQQFGEHFDWFSNSAYFEGRGNRLYTFMVYLNDDFEGGETNFPKLIRSVRPKAGMAVIWKNLSDSGAGNDFMLHAGMPVLSGSKYILTRWFRERSFFHSSEGLPRLTSLGFEVKSVPEGIFKTIKNAYDSLKDSACNENSWGVLENVSGGVATEMMSLDRLPLVRDLLLQGLLAEHERWAGIALRPASCYGIRSYKNGSILKMHKDRVETHHVSSIIIVDEDGERWPLDIRDHAGDLHHVYARPGDMIMYESAVCEHGRMTPYSGNFFRNLFVHYSLMDWVYRQG